MTALLTTSAVAPVLRAPEIRSEQVTQLVLGEPARLRAEAGDWRQITTVIDGYDGWVHRGYFRETGDAEADAWLRDAAWSDGATVLAGPDRVVIPLRGRVRREEDVIVLPDGRAGGVQDGVLADPAFMRESARRMRPDQWARRRYQGAPYQWGGVTPWGVDCSGLVQTAWLVRGIVLPRDAGEQFRAGTAVAPDAIAPGDLLFFTDGAGAGITHVGIAGEGETLVHATLRRGGFVIERRAELPWLMERLAGVRRIPEPDEVA